MSKLIDSLNRYKAAIEKVLRGKESVVEMAIASLLAGGHLLLEDFPGVGKTTLASVMAKGISGHFSRVQFTADLLPADVLGVRIFRRSEEKFEFVHGPIFCNIILADELNRAPPKTQSALLQAMNEGQVTIDQETFKLPHPFMVIATQNPRGYHGTYPLPESQRDRFMMRLSIGYPDSATEVMILKDRRETDPSTMVEKVLTLEEIGEAQKEVRKIEIPDPCYVYMNRLAEATRKHEEVLIPASPRALLALMRASQGFAYLRCQKFVDIDIIKHLSPFVLAHRLGLRSLGQTHTGEGAPAAWITKEILQRIPVE